MLREHFRCVPEIIGFSNMLSYDYKIKPLRDSSNNILLPAVVNYRVADGKRECGKTNPNEAKAIVALMQACIQQPEYADKTFGVISLLGDEQVRLIQQIIEEHIDSKDLIERNILCGNASQFQGDERDVIFLSVVDSASGNGPIKLQGFGSDDAIRKRYNVAASRAKDQLWVIHSLDAATELKPGDIRKTLIDYAANPDALSLRHTEIEEKADSPFEIAVARALVDRGYRLVQQWQVGAYRLDIVVICGKKTVAIECDGERYHSGEAKIREDMERQTILERLGWRFIRIRGSEYFRNPEQTIERVINKLTEYEIMPDSDSSQHTSPAPATDLLNRVKLRAANILHHIQNTDPIPIDTDTIRTALDPKNMIPKINPNVPIPPANLNRTKRPLTEAQIMAGAHAAKSIFGKKTAILKKSTQDLTKEKSLPSKTLLTYKEDTSSQKEKKQTKPITSRQRLPQSKTTASGDIIAELDRLGIPYIDKRSNKGALWIIGGLELKGIVMQLKNFGATFVFKSTGGKATKGKPGWWTK
ncbi:MAG: DUF559 domain-containing protein [Selenomonadales bacterium]|nr:DUF559 domain-containing protein [Selenomonadales bacterium]